MRRLALTLPAALLTLAWAAPVQAQPTPLERLAASAPPPRAPGWAILTAEALPLLCADLPLRATCTAPLPGADALPLRLAADLLTLPALESAAGHPHLLLAASTLRALAAPGGLQALPGLLRAAAPQADPQAVHTLAERLEPLLSPLRAPEARLQDLALLLPGLEPPRLQRLDALLTGAAAPTPDTLRDLASLLTALVARHLPGAPPPPLLALHHLAALAAGEPWERVLPDLLRDAPLPAPEPLPLALSLALDPRPERALHALRTALLGPWSEPLLFDLNASLPALDLDRLDFKVFFDALVGLQLPQGGLIARGGLNAYDLTTATTAEDLTAPQGQLDLWYTSAPAPWRWEARAQLRVAAYDTSRVSLLPGDNILQDASSLTLRGLLLVGLRAEEGPDAFGLWLGAGAQREDFSALTLTANALVISQERAESRLTLNARLRAQRRLGVQALTLRARADLLRAALTQADLDAATLRTRTLWQGEARVFLDADALAFWGWTPALHLGLDLLALDDDADLIPSLGLGLRRVAF